MHGKNAITKSSQVIELKTLAPPPIRILDLGKEVDLVVGLPEVVLDVVVLRRDAEFDELAFEGATLLEEKMGLATYFHQSISLILSNSDVRNPRFPARSTRWIFFCRAQAQMV